MLEVRVENDGAVAWVRTIPGRPRLGGEEGPVRGSIHRRTHVLILAGGEGRRLADFTRDEQGRCVPKQFALRSGGQTLFEATVGRMRGLVAAEQITAVLAAAHWQWWARQVGGLDDSALVVQPADRGSAAAVLLGLQHVVARDPAARVLVLPSDHVAEDERGWSATLVDLIDVMHEDSERVVVLGMPADDFDPAYGWIVAGRHRSALAQEIVGLYHDVAPPTADGFNARGALLYGGVVAGSADALIALHARSIPGLLAAFQGALGTLTEAPAAVVEQLYSAIPSRDFTRDVVAPVADTLSVVRGRRCGWSDLDTPERLAAYRGASEGRRRPRSPAVHV